MSLIHITQVQDIPIPHLYLNFMVLSSTNKCVVLHHLCLTHLTMFKAILQNYTGKKKKYIKSV